MAGEASAGYGGNLGRSLLEGLTFNNAGELEAALRAAAAQRNISLDELMRRYRDTKAQVVGDHQRWIEKNPRADLAANFAGMLVPGVVGAFVPGGQGATAAAATRGASFLPRVARAMAEPVTVMAERFAPSAAANLASRGALGRLALPLADEMLTGAVQSVGSADTLAEAPDRVASELLENAIGSLAVRGVTAGGKRVIANRKARKAAK